MFKGQFRQKAASGICKGTAPELYYKEGAVEHSKLFEKVDFIASDI